jgi:ribonuclease E
VIRAIRDYFNHDIGDILIDTDDVYDQAQQFMAHVMPEHAARVKRYRDDAPLFSRFQIEHQIETAYARTVTLPSGGAIVIDHTEALVSVDVNSARAIKGGDIEETATRTNLEAADEVARQARLRDLGGLIVIDFIDMEESRNRRDVENRLRDALRQDRARVQFGTISKFGLMEMSRQRLRPALSEGASIPCPRCGGSGHIRDTESSALQILRIIQEESLKDNTASVLCQVPVEVASFLLNEKRTEIAKIELKQRINVLMVPNKSLETPNYRLERLKHDDPRLDNITASYKMAEEIEDATSVTRRSQEPTNRQTPLIKGVLPDAPAPVVPPKAEPASAAPVKPHAQVSAPAPVVAEKGFFGWIKNLFAPAPKVPQAQPPVPAPAVADSTDARAPRDGRPSRDGSRRNEARGDRPDGRGPRGDGRNGRSPRPERGGRPERAERPERSPRERQDSQANAVTTDAVGLDASAQAPGLNAETNQQRPERTGRNPRGERRPPRGPRTDADQRPAEPVEAPPISNADSPESPNANLVAPDDQTQGDGTERNESGRRDKRSRDRYGRERKPRGERTERSNTEGAESVEAQSVLPLEAPPVADEDMAPRKSYFSAPAVVSVANTIATQAQSPVPSDLPPAAAPIDVPPAVTPIAPMNAPVDAAAAITLAPVVSAPSMPKVEPYSLPLEELSQIAQQSGLQWVLSNAEKVAAAQASIAAQVLPTRTPRERPPTPAPDERPLMLVETRRDLRNTTLPFETTQVH